MKKVSKFTSLKKCFIPKELRPSIKGQFLNAQKQYGQVDSKRRLK